VSRRFSPRLPSFAGIYGNEFKSDLPELDLPFRPFTLPSPYLALSAMLATYLALAPGLSSWIGRQPRPLIEASGSGLPGPDSLRPGGLVGGWVDFSGGRLIAERQVLEQ